MWSLFSLGPLTSGVAKVRAHSENNKIHFVTGGQCLCPIVTSKRQKASRVKEILVFTLCWRLQNETMYFLTQEGIALPT